MIETRELTRQYGPITAVDRISFATVPAGLPVASAVRAALAEDDTTPTLPGDTGTVEHLLFGVGATDPWTFALMTGIPLLVAVLASALPARRASRVDPLVSLRHD